MATKRISRRYFLKVGLAGLMETALVTTMGLGYGIAVEPGQVRVENIRLTLPNLHPAFNGYRLIQISDLHVDDGLKSGQLDEVVETINLLNADLIAITGDFVTRNAEGYADVLRETLGQLRAPDGVVAVPGNHDHWSNIEVIRTVLAESGIRDLSNRVMTLKRGEAQLHMAGVDDIWENKHDLDAVLAQLPTHGAAILMAHEPDFADESAATERFDLQISGHTHGGQVVLPVVGSPILPYLGRKYPIGLYKVGNMWQYTNRGLASVIPVRINCYPEITVFTFESAEV